MPCRPPAPRSSSARQSTRAPPAVQFASTRWCEARLPAEQVVVAPAPAGSAAGEELVQVLDGGRAVVARHRIGQGVPAENSANDQTAIGTRQALQILHVPRVVAVAEEIILDVRHVE